MIEVNADLLRQIEGIAVMAGEAIMEIYQKDFAVDYKSDESPLTETDTCANRIILDELRKLHPNTHILSEESSEYFQQAQTPDEYFLVDPLDGTKEFVKKNGEFTVNIALIQSGVSVLGVVYAPVLKSLYSAAKGIGAYLSNDDGRKAIQVKPQKSSVRVLVSRSHLDAKTGQFLLQLEDHIPIPMGSSLKMCLIASGEADIYPRFGPTSLWDTGAAQAVLEEAGGIMVDLTGEPLSYANPKQVLNSEFIATSLDWKFIQKKLQHI
jgi:3'(2'), 5'-bisphosphate nucleotidase